MLPYWLRFMAVGLSNPVSGRILRFWRLSGSVFSQKLLPDATISLVAICRSWSRLTVSLNSSTCCLASEALGYCSFAVV